MRTKLTEAEVTEIFSYRWENKDTSDSPLIGKCHVLAKRFKVSPKAIRDIWNMRTWTHVTHPGASSSAPHQKPDDKLNVKEVEEGKMSEDLEEAAGRRDTGCSPISFPTDESGKASDKKLGHAICGKQSAPLGQAQAIRDMLRRQMADTEMPIFDLGSGLQSSMHEIPTPPTSTLNGPDMPLAPASHENGLGKRARPDMMPIDLAAGLNSNHPAPTPSGMSFDQLKRARSDFRSGLSVLGNFPGSLSTNQAEVQKLPKSSHGAPRDGKGIDPSILESLARLNVQQQTWGQQHSAAALSRMGTMMSLPVQPGSGPLSGPLSGSTMQGPPSGTPLTGPAPIPSLLQGPPSGSTLPQGPSSGNSVLQGPSSNSLPQGPSSGGSLLRQSSTNSLLGAPRLQGPSSGGAAGGALSAQDVTASIALLQQIINSTAAASKAAAQQKQLQQQQQLQQQHSARGPNLLGHLQSMSQSSQSPPLPAAGAADAWHLRGLAK